MNFPLLSAPNGVWAFLYPILSVSHTSSVLLVMHRVCVVVMVAAAMACYAVRLRVCVFHVHVRLPRGVVPSVSRAVHTGNFGPAGTAGTVGGFGPQGEKRRFL